MRHGSSITLRGSRNLPARHRLRVQLRLAEGSKPEEQPPSAVRVVWSSPDKAAIKPDLSSRGGTSAPVEAHESDEPLRVVYVAKAPSDELCVSHLLSLAGRGAVVRAVVDAAEALQVLRQDRHDLVVVSGCEVAISDVAILCAGCSSSGDPPVVVITDTADAGEEFCRAGATDYVVRGNGAGAPAAPGARSLVKLIEANRSIREARQALHTRVESTATLVNVVSHDMRNLLHAVSLSAAYLERRKDMPDGTPKAVRRIKSSGKWALRLIRDLVVVTHAALGKGVPLMPVRTDLCELAQQVVDEFADFRPDHAISFTCDALPPGMWDADRLTQLLSNLAMHAMDHTAAGLPIALRMTARDQGVQFEVHFPTVPTADSHEEPTENFAQDVVDQIVRAHRGTFHVHADAAQTRFVVWLPQRQASDDEVQRE